MAREHYLERVRLLLRLLPSVLEERDFALKGGTAINLFFRDMPRLSVGIDLVFLPIANRAESLARMDQMLNRIAAHAENRLRNARFQRISGGGGGDTRLLARQGAAEIKIEVSPAMRGAVFPPSLMTAKPGVEETFGFAEALVSSFADVYGGKIHAALDRQHPRDLFDVKLLYENEGLTDEIVRTALVYIASSGRPFHELLAPHRLDIAETYEKEFVGMTAEPAPLDALYEIRERLFSDIRAMIDDGGRRFLRSFQACAPEWDALGLEGLEALPALRWKLLNLQRLRTENPEKHREQSKALDAALSAR
jgi:hypothetical protein